MFHPTFNIHNLQLNICCFHTPANSHPQYQKAQVITDSHNTKETTHTDTHTNMQTVVMTAAVPEPDWMADTSPALQISSGGNHSNNAITIPVATLTSFKYSKYESTQVVEPCCQLHAICIRLHQLILQEVKKLQRLILIHIQIDFRSTEE